MTCQAILITGLRRSGTTIVWETFRRDPRTLCFDEPFHPRLWQGARQNAKGTWDELGAFWDAVRPDVDSDLEPIKPLDELEAESSPAQIAYLRQLATQGDNVVIDVVRAWNRLPELLASDVSVHVVHLVRDPIGWVTAHLMPSGPGTWRKGIGDRYRRATAFRRRGFYNNWQYEEIINAALAQRHPVWTAAGITPEVLLRQPAYIKLAAFWWAANLTTHRRLAAWGGGPVTTITLGEFTADPARCVRTLLDRSGWDTLGPESPPDVQPLRPGIREDSTYWPEAFSQLGMPSALSSHRRLSGAELATLFQAHASAHGYTPERLSATRT